MADRRRATQKYAQNPDNKKMIAAKRIAERLLGTGKLNVDMSYCRDCGAFRDRIEKYYPMGFNDPTFFTPLCPPCHRKVRK